MTPITPVETVTTRSKSKAVKRVFCIMSVIALMAVMFCAPAFAAEGGTLTTIEGGIKSGAESVYNIVRLVAGSIAGACLAISGLVLIFNRSNEQEIQKAKKACLISAIALAVVLLAPVIVSNVIGWFDNGTSYDPNGIFDVGKVGGSTGA